MDGVLQSIPTVYRSAALQLGLHAGFVPFWVAALLVVCGYYNPSCKGKSNLLARMSSSCLLVVWACGVYSKMQVGKGDGFDDYQ
jgi:hypothetical protein